MPRLTLEEVKALAYRALVASKTSPGNAESVADSLAAAEADGIASHGLLRLPTYCAHARSGKVDGLARPTLTHSGPATFRVDACNGFAHPAIALALEELARDTAKQGIAAAAIFNSYNSGVMGHHVEQLARRGLVALAFANAPAVMAPWGGKKPVFGTNPIAFAVPRGTGDPIVIDQASTVVARGEIMLRTQRGEPIPPEWVLEGGTLAPSGGHKGANMAFLVEIMAATLTGSLHSFEGGSLTQDDGKPAGVGQSFIAIEPARLAGEGFQKHVEALCEAMLEEPGVRLAGARRYEARAAAKVAGVEVGASILEAIKPLQS